MFGDLAQAMAMGLRRKRLGEDRQYERDQGILAHQQGMAEREDQRRWREAQAERQAKQDALAEEMTRLQIADHQAQAAGTGRYAPQPVRKPWEAQGFGSAEEQIAYEAQRARATREPRQAPEVNWQVMQAADGSTYERNPRTGQMRPVVLPDGQPFRGPTPSTQRPPTEGMRKAGAFYAAGKQGYDTLEAVLGGDDPTTPEVETGGAKPVPGWFAQQAAKVGIGAGNVMTNEQVRQMRQAGLMLSDAWLRYTSGAAVPETEVERFAESFLPRAGDDPQTLRQKAASRKTIIEALRQGAGTSIPDPTDASTYTENPYR